MADRCLLLTWGEVVRGREERAVECFNDSLGYYGRLQQEGKIETFDAVLCAVNGGRLDGYIRLDGTARQLLDVKEDREFQRLTAEATTCVENIAVTDAYCNNGISVQMEIFAEAIAKVPQMG
jgi:hypothetical protein